MDRDTLIESVLTSIASMLEDRKLKYIADTYEFGEGLKIGLEIAGIYGDKIKEIYIGNRITDNNITPVE